jgi:hypothetical protein
LSNKIRPTAAVLVAAFCVLAVSSAFIVFYGQVFQPSPLLNTNMKFWTIDPTKNIPTPYLWTIDVIQGPTDNVTVYQTSVADRPSIALRVDRSNPNNSQVWTTLHVRQDLRGQALQAIFRSKITLDVYPTFPYWYNPNSKNPENTFGIEINDGTNLLWYVFADEPTQIFQLPHHRIILTQTPLNTWSSKEIHIASQYAEAGWKTPESISFILILGTTWIHPGDWVGYFSALSVNVAPLQTQNLSPTQTLTVLAIDAVVLILLGAILVGYRKRKIPGRAKRARGRVR